MNISLLDSAEHLQAQAPAWDDLWQRSDLASPASQAELVDCWLAQFAPGAPFRAITVWENDRMVAALPLVENRRMGATTTTPWSCCGELLVDPGADLPAVAGHLVEGLRDVPWPFLLIRYVRIESPGWRALLSAINQAGGAAFAHRTHSVGRVALPNDFDAYMASRSGNHRRHMRKADRRIEREGGAELRVLDRLPPSDVRAALQEGFDVEDRSWKGPAGTSVLRTPGMCEYFIRQAELLAARRQLYLVFLLHRARPIAFEYGWRARQTYFTPKIGYDQAYARYSPGQLLLYNLFRRFTAEPRPPGIDFDGPLADATEQWSTETYTVGHVALSCRPVTGRGWVGGYRLLRAAKRRWVSHR